jgi:hypothetical protein
MTDDFNVLFQSTLDAYQSAITSPLTHVKYYLCISPDVSEPLEYIIIKYAGDFSLIKDMYSEMLFYGEFFLDDGVEMFRVNREAEGKKVTVINV